MGWLFFHGTKIFEMGTCASDRMEHISPLASQHLGKKMLIGIFFEQSKCYNRSNIICVERSRYIEKPFESWG